MQTKKVKALGVIPARLGSTRLAEKVLKPIDGRPMIQHVWEKASRAQRLDKVVVACDDKRIRECVESFGGIAVLTSKDHPNGTSRVAEAAKREDGFDIVVNIQGDEPLIHPQAIDALVEVFDDFSDIQVGTLAVRLEDREVFENPNAVKVITDQHGNALYFSRSPLPYYREPHEVPFSFLKHLGIYAYQMPFLFHFCDWPQSTLERVEKLEQLRILEKGFEIRVVETQHNSLSVDTSEDLERVEAEIRKMVKTPGA